MKKVRTTSVAQANVYPMRINKYLAHKGVATRTGVDELIKHQKVLINGNIAKLGDKVLETDNVEVRGVHTKKKYVYFAYNKPKGIVSTNPQDEEKEIMQNINFPQGSPYRSSTPFASLDDAQGLAKSQRDFSPVGKVFPVGRLDKESHGLIILTNDGRITDRLLNPIYNHEKEYVVEVDRKFTPAFLKHMQDGIDIGEGVTKPAIVKKLGDKTFSIILTEGKNRQIRRMTEKLGYTVRDLQRIRVQNIELGKLPINSHRGVTGEEQSVFLKSVGL